ncbi:MAG: fasciclin domain-containing protein [Planctomycetes bacterium]|nr:fasciclin domain-containing protein [Planctomycetota bacterium]
MMNTRRCLLALISLAFAGCSSEVTPPQPRPAVAAPKKQAYPLDPNNIVNIAVGSKDHTTLVAALQAAEYVRSVANPGPLTVFAPTNAAFDKLPAGTVETLVKPENQAKLQEILKYHVTTSVYETKDLKDGMQLGMANLGKVRVTNKDGKVTINGANVVASVRGSNGIVHVIDAVLLPPEK